MINESLVELKPYTICILLETPWDKGNIHIIRNKLINTDDYISIMKVCMGAHNSAVSNKLLIKTMMKVLTNFQRNNIPNFGFKALGVWATEKLGMKIFNVSAGIIEGHVDTTMKVRRIEIHVMSHPNFIKPALRTNWWQTTNPCFTIKKWEYK